MKLFSNQFMHLLKHSLRVERADPQRFLSSFLFGVTILFLFSFAIGELPTNLRLQLALSEVFLCSFLVLQLVHQRILTTEQDDRAIDILMSSPISYSILYLVKVSLAIFLSAVVIIPFVGFLQILHGVSIWNFSFLGILGLVILGLSSLGVLLSQMTEKAAGRDLLFPLLYFPLTVPVLLAAVQASFCLWGISNQDSLDLWLGLLSVFCIIYLTLGVLLFEELVGLD